MRQLRNLDPNAIDAAGDAWGRLTGHLGAARDRVGHGMLTELRGSWEGRAANRAFHRLDRLTRNLQYGCQESGYVRTLLDACVSELRFHQRNLLQALEDAESHGFTVDDDGTVGWPPPKPGEPPAHPSAPGHAREPVNPEREAADEIAERIASAVRGATRVDEEYAGGLRRMTAEGGVDVDAATWSDVAGDRRALDSVRSALGLEPVPTGNDPGANAAWWKSLSGEQRREYLALHPERIGALDGIPSADRDSANRIVLETTRAELLEQLERLEQNEPGKEFYDDWWHPGDTAHDAWRAEISELRGKLEGIEAIQDRFDASGVDGLPEAYLLGFDPERDGRVILANGNPDTADHTAVYVPGTGSDLANIGGGITRMDDTWRESSELAPPGESVSTVTWLGYDAPDDVVRDAPFSHYANEGAPALSRFTEGLDVAHESDEGSHTTVMGHSYGTTLVGSASQRGGLNADDVVLVGSPGVQVGRASEMGVPEGHVWSQEAEGDHVPDIGRYGHGGSRWDIGGGVFLTPSDDAFGAERMTTDTEGHSDYWTPRSESLRNQAAVITGEYSQVERR